MKSPAAKRGCNLPSPLLPDSTDLPGAQKEHAEGIFMSAAEGIFMSAADGNNHILTRLCTLAYGPRSVGVGCNPRRSCGLLDVWGGEDIPSLPPGLSLASKGPVENP